MDETTGHNRYVRCNYRYCLINNITFNWNSYKYDIVTAYCKETRVL